MVSTVSPPLYKAARHGAGRIDRSARGRLVVSGADRATYLQGLLTNDIVAITSGRGCYAAYLTPQGRMITDLFVYELGDLMLISLPLAVKDAVLAKFEQFVFTEDVTLGDVTETFAQMAVVGPRAAAALAAVVEDVSPDTLNALDEHANMRVRIRRRTGDCDARRGYRRTGLRRLRRAPARGGVRGGACGARRRGSGRSDRRGDSHRSRCAEIRRRHGRGARFRSKRASNRGRSASPKAVTSARR